MFTCRTAGALVFAALVSTGLGAAQAETFRQNEIRFEVRPDGTFVSHRTRCRGCTVYRREQVGPVMVARPPVDYRQSLPIYQPPLYTHPSQVVPVDPRRRPGGAYGVTGAPGPRHRHEPLRGHPAWYPGGGSEARVIRLTDPPGPRRP